MRIARRDRRSSSAARLLVALGLSATCLLGWTACDNWPPDIPDPQPGSQAEQRLPAFTAFLSTDRSVLIRGDSDAGNATLRVTTNRDGIFAWALDPADLLTVDPTTPTVTDEPATTAALKLTGVRRDPGAQGTPARISVTITVWVCEACEDENGAPLWCIGDEPVADVSECEGEETLERTLTIEVRRPEAPLTVSLVAVEGTSMQPAGKKQVKAVISGGKPFGKDGGTCQVPDDSIGPVGNTNGKPYCMSWRVIENLELDCENDEDCNDNAAGTVDRCRCQNPPYEPGCEEGNCEWLNVVKSERFTPEEMRSGKVEEQEDAADTIAEAVYKAPAANGSVTFQVTVVDAAGPSIQREVTVDILSRGTETVSLEAAADHPDLCTGETATITATASGGTGNNTFTFSLVGGALPGETLTVSGTQATYKAPAGQAVTRTIRVTVSEAGGSSDQTNVVITTITLSSCDDGNTCTGDTCSFGTCGHANVSGSCDDGNACTTGDVCSDGLCTSGPVRDCNDGNPCTDDECVAGACTHKNNTAACNDGNACTTGDVCSAGLCVSGPVRNCDDGNPCTDDSCNTTSGCQNVNDNSNDCDDGLFCSGTETCSDGTCVHSGDPCTGGAECADLCDEANNTCNRAVGSPCTDDGIECTSDVCNAGACTHPFKNVGTACGNPIPEGPCDDPNTCDGAGNCELNYKPATWECRGGGGECNPAEFCTGTGPTCPVDAFSPGSTPCTDDGNICTNDVCNGVGGCVHPVRPAGTYLCRADAGDCDVPEFCDGVGVGCPVDLVEPNTTQCRAAAGDCDAAEFCDGVGVGCPADLVEPNTTECRAAAGDCDTPEFCDGVGVGCPADLVEPNTTECRAAAGDCDIPESCDGVGVGCPADQVEPNTTECRASAGDCDVAEFCDGVSVGCPADLVEPNTTECRAVAGDCDIPEFCDGVSVGCPADLVEPNTTECRADAGDCDVPEFCDGISIACPADGFEPNGTGCDDGMYCNENETCADGVCGGGNALDCGDSLTCTTDACNEGTDSCDNNLEATSCLIGGACYLDLDPNPANECQQCDVALDQGNWSNVTDGSPCTTCGATPACECQAGVCVDQ